MAQEEKPNETPTFRVVDRRAFIDADHLDVGKAEPDRPRFPTYVEELMARVAETERRFEDRKRQIDEDIGRTRLRLESDLERRLELEKQKIALPFLEVFDNLERALAAAASGPEQLLQGLQMTLSLFRSKLQALGIEDLSVLGQPYDPNVAQAVGMVDLSDSSRDGLVVEEVLRGYRMGDQLLRPAMVRVGRYAVCRRP